MPYRESHYHSYRSREITHPSIPSYSYARSQPLFAYLRRPTTHIIIYDHSHGGSNNNNNNTKKESDDAFCRRKDRYYARLADDLAAAKKHKGMVGKLMDDAREHHEYKNWKTEYHRVNDEVKVLERKVEDERRSILKDLR